LLYGTTNKFLEHFGFSDLEDLPQTEDLPVILKGEDIPDSVGSVISGELETKNNEEIMTTEQEIDDLTDGGGVVPLTSPVE